MATDPWDDYYALLGVDAGANQAQLRRAWRQLALRWHPDRAGSGAKATFQKISAAYTVLSDPAARAAYDRQRGIPAPVPAPTPSRSGAPSVMLQRLSGQLNTLVACGIARRAEDDVIELFLTADEASKGGHATIAMRVPIACPACAVNPAVSCARCGRTRTVDELFSAWLAIPPDVADGAILKPTVLLPGMLRPVSFRVRRESAA